MEFLIALLLLSSCMKKEEAKIQVNNEFEVERLFTHQGCTVYRFWDGRKVYFTDCSGSAKWKESCGKNCTTDVNVD